MSEIFDHVVASRYLQPGETTFDDVLHRVANFIGDSDEERAEYYEMMSKGYFLPNSPTLMNAGTDNPMLSACFALPVEDSIEGIFDAVKWAAMVHKQGGGTGFNFHKIRPKGSTVRSTNGVASGVVSFMKVFDAATEAIKQGGKRRGANIGVLPIDHPEIREFITCKQKEGDIKNFNISVMLNDEFMKNVSDNKCRDTQSESLFDLIAESIWNNGEPGIKFYDAIQKANTTPWLGELIDGNPCSEALLYPFESCNLGSIDVSKFEPEKILDMDRVVRKAVKFLNKVIDKNQYPLPQIDEATKQTRKIGLGVMGLHDLLLKLGIPYDCERAREIATFVMDEINHVASVESEHLAYDYEPYPSCTNGAHYRRNAMVTCIAPTGSLSILANCSSGIEPVYSWVYKRKNTVGEEFMYVHPLFEKALKDDLSRVYPDKDDLVYTMVINHCYTYGTIQNNKFVSPEFKALWKSALDISYKDHILMQSAFQKHVDQAISKCVAKGTLVQTNRGVIPIEELGDARGVDVFGKCLDDLYVTDENGNAAKVLSHYSGGQKKTIRVRMDNGATIEGTHNHRIMTPEGWKTLGELSVGDIVKNRSTDLISWVGNGGAHIEGVDFYHNGNGCTNVTIPSHMTADLAKFLGMMCSDGYTNEQSGLVSLTTADGVVENEFRRIVKSVFGTDVRVVYDSRTENTRTVAFTSRSTVRWINALIGTGCRNKCAPWQILQGSESEMLRFVEGVTLDGYVKKVGNHKVERCVLVLYEGYSQRLRDQMYSMLVHLGERPYKNSKTVTYNEKSRGKTYAVSIDSNITTPIELHKQCKIDPIARRVMSELEVPHTTNESSLSLSLDRIRNRYTGIITDRKCDKYGIPYDGTVFYTKVSDIEESEAEVYDIEVEGTHSYCIDGVISHNTVNMPQNATIDDVKDAILLAWKEGCKGLTIYRTGSRDDVVLALKDDEKEMKEEHAAWESASITSMERRPPFLEGKTYKVRSGCGKLYVTINHCDGKPYEVFVKSAGNGGCDANNNAIGRLISIALRNGVELDAITKQLSRVTCPSAMKNGCDYNGKSCADIIGKILRECSGETTPTSPIVESNRKVNVKPNRSMICPECKGELTRDSGCVVCNHCGYSRC